MEHSLPLQINTEFLAGPRLVGIVLNWYLHGLLTVQYILYLMNSRKDTPVLRFTVHFLFALDSTQTIFTMVDGFFWFVYNFGDPTKLFQFHFASIDVPTFDAVIAFVVQVVYCWRIWRLSQWKIASALIFLVALVTAVCGFIAGVRDFVAQGDLARNPGNRFPLKIWLIGSAFTDIIIASSMTYILLRARRNTIEAQGSIARKMMRIMTLILETNAITAAVAIGTVAIFFSKSFAPPRTFFNEPGYAPRLVEAMNKLLTATLDSGYVLGKLYSNCFMILLNQRHWDSSTQENTEITVELGTIADSAFEWDTRPAGGSTSNNGATGNNGTRTPRQLAPPNLVTNPEKTRSSK